MTTSQLSVDRKINQAAAVLLISMPCTFLAFPVKIASFQIALTTLLWAYLSLREKSLLKFRQANFLVSLPILNYLILLAGMISTTNVGMGLRTMETKIPLLVFPIVFFTGHDILSGIKKKRILITYSLAVFAISVLVIAHPLLVSTARSGYSFKELSSIINIHPGYYSLYVGFAILILLAYLPSFSKAKAAAVILILLFLFIFNLLLVARMPMIGLIICIFIYLLIVRKLKIVLLLLAAIPLFVLLVGLQNPDWSHRILSPLRMLSTGDFDGLEYFAYDRVQEFTCTIEMLSIDYNLLTGFGTGDDNDVLFQCYSEHGYDWVLSQKYNAHNQYLQSTLQTGVVGGFLCFLLITAPLFSKSVRLAGNLDFILFSCLFAVFSLTESTLEVQKGIVFFSFFYCLLTYFMRPHKQQHIINDQRSD